MYTKLIFDNIHQYIEISSLAKIIIDTPSFQRLRHISQLGTCSYIFPSGNHSRFEHSLGVYNLTGKMLENIRKNNSEQIIVDINNIGKVTLNDRIIELVKIGGLCHDLGHGPFSHVFDDLILQNVQHENKYHEIRSCKLLKKIINENVNKDNYIINNNLCITDDEIKFIQDIINPKEDHKSFIYQVVSNNINSIDVDKFDYISRDTNNVGLKNGFDYSRMLEEVKVINNKICYPKQTYLHLCNLFTTRYYLHKQIYNHKTVKSIEYMYLDIIKLLDPILGIKDSIQDLDKFIIFTDNFITNFLDLIKLKSISKNTQFNISTLDDTLIEKAQNILQKLKTRKLYKFVGDYTITKTNNKMIYFKDFIDINNNIQENDIIISSVKIGYISGDKDNPLDNIYLYDKKNSSKCFQIKKENITNFLPESYQETCVKIFCTNINKFEIICNAFNQIKNSWSST